MFTSVIDKDFGKGFIFFNPDDGKESDGSIPYFKYFFGKKLHEELGVPIGLIHSSWGGSPAESWARTDFIEKIKGFDEKIFLYYEENDFYQKCENLKYNLYLHLYVYVNQLHFLLR